MFSLVPSISARVSAREGVNQGYVALNFLFLLRSLQPRSQAPYAKSNLIVSSDLVDFVLSSVIEFVRLAVTTPA